MRNEGWRMMQEDEEGWKRMKKDVGGWRRMKEDEGGWRRMMEDEGGWRRIKEDQGAWRRIKKDQEGWRRMKEKGWRILSCKRVLDLWWTDRRTDRWTDIGDCSPYRFYWEPLWTAQEWQSIVWTCQNSESQITVECERAYLLHPNIPFHSIEHWQYVCLISKMKASEWCPKIVNDDFWSKNL